MIHMNLILINELIYVVSDKAESFKGCQKQSIHSVL